MGLSWTQLEDIARTEGQVLKAISQGCNWEFGLQQALHLKAGKAHGTLRRLEAHGFLTSEFAEVGNRQRRVYSLTQQGLDRLL